MVSVGSLRGQGRKRQAKDGGVWVPLWEEDDGVWEGRGFQDKEYGKPRTSVELTDTEFLAALDSVFTFASSTKQFVVNTMSVSEAQYHCHVITLSFRPWEGSSSWCS